MSTKNYWDIVFFLACFIPTGYYVHFQVSSFISNEDVVSISYRSFNQEARDEYPHYTLCFMALRGLDVHVPFERIVQKLPKNHTYRGDWLTRIVTSLSLTFKDSFRVCYTKNVSFPRHFSYKRDYIWLNATFLSDTFSFLQVFFHKRNQLLRTIDEPKQIIQNKWFKGGTNYVFSILDVEVLRRREDSNMPCNKSLTDEDSHAMGIIMDKYHCIPSYWRKLPATEKKGQTLPTCSKQQYAKIKVEYRNLIDRFGTPRELYRPPCETMRIVEGVQMRGVTNHSDTFKMFFEYQQHSYKEMVNKRGFTAQDLLSQVGGFVGK